MFIYNDQRLGEMVCELRTTTTFIDVFPLDTSESYGVGGSILLPFHEETVSL